MITNYPEEEYEDCLCFRKLRYKLGKRIKPGMPKTELEQAKITNKNKMKNETFTIEEMQERQDAIMADQDMAVAKS